MERAPDPALLIPAAGPAAAFPAALALPTSDAGRRWPLRVLLVTSVVVLGLLQGSRTALGSAPLPSAPQAAESASPPAREADWRRGHFYRPAGSAAVRPRPLLRPVVWLPEPAPARVATRCAGRADGSC
jgi:hypothetical protein